MRPPLWVVCVLFCALATGCKKDGDAPAVRYGSTLSVHFALHCNGRPFSTDSVYSDGFGTAVRFSRVRFALLDPAMLGDQGQDMGRWTKRTLLATSDAAAVPVELPEPRTGEVHWLDVRTGAVGDAADPALLPLLVEGHDATFLAVLDLQGTYDSNGNGLVEPGEAQFRIAVPAGATPLALRVHAHAIVAPEVPADIRIPVNVIHLLKDIDLPDRPITLGEGPYATQVLANLQSIVLGIDHEPI
jgi:hypothetical protein